MTETSDNVRRFYDALAPDYDLMFADWDASSRWQGERIAELLGGPPRRVLDLACGMGTQSLGLARLGWDVVGRDLSPELLDRARAAAERLGLTPTLEEGDMRVARDADRGRFDAVIAIDNALPHLDTEEDLIAAFRTARSALGPGGVFLASVRDYDALIEERPRFDPPRIVGEGADERVVMQVWTWLDERRYQLDHMVLVRGDDGRFEARSQTGRYRATTRAELEDAAKSGGFAGFEWMTADEAGFFQPVFRARAGWR